MKLAPVKLSHLVLSTFIKEHQNSGGEVRSSSVFHCTNFFTLENMKIIWLRNEKRLQIIRSYSTKLKSCNQTSLFYHIEILFHDKKK